jgi:hypothetical protein
MYFLAHADFSFPLSFGAYFNEHFYIWSFNTGSLNFDGVLRVLTLLPNLFLFWVSGSSVLTAFFYIFSIAAISFTTFFYFLRYFLKSSDTFYNIVLSLFFAFNPVFLGNESKAGLILGVAMLPLLITSVRKYFESKDILYFIIAVGALNVSLIHPFVFIVNAAIVGVYYILQKYSRWRRGGASYWPQLAREILLAMALNAFVFLALISLGTLDKATILNDAIPQADTGALLEYANTGGLINSFTFSKDVLRDFDFYSDKYKSIYFSSSFVLYVFILGGYILLGRDKHLNRRAFLMLLIGTLVVQLLATGDWLGVDRILNFLVKIPGGWAFRSPLKWQLYLPMFLFGACGVLSGSFTARYRKIFLISLVVLFFGMNSYVALDVYEKLLTPKKISVLSAFEALPIQNATFLLVGGENCSSINDELNEVLLSKNVQTKKVPQDQLSKIYFQAFSYVISCRSIPIDGFNFLSEVSSKEFFAYKNREYRPPVFSFTDLYSLDSLSNFDAKYEFVNGQLGNQLHFVTATIGRAIPVTRLIAPFEDLRPENISSNSTLVATVAVDLEKNTLYSLGRLGGIIHLGNQSVSRFPKVVLTLPVGENTVTYQDRGYSFSNLIPNSSFESGTWQGKVGDCHNYDKNPVIAMTLNTQDKSNGIQSLQLEAIRHNACTSIRIPVKVGAHYLLSFDYQSPNKSNASYYLGFDDKAKKFLRGNLLLTDTAWHTFSQVITVPDGATSAGLYVYATQIDEQKNAINRYDNFKFIEVPDIANSYYLISSSVAGLKNPTSVSFDLINPTKKMVHVSGATTAFFLAVNDSYHAKWRLESNDTKVQGFLNSWWPFAKPDRILDEYHYQLDGFLNAWYVDVPAFCVNNNASCVRNVDGSYDVEMQIEFTPQRWFYLGLLISGVTLAGCLGYLGYEAGRRLRRRYTKNNDA